MFGYLMFDCCWIEFIGLQDTDFNMRPHGYNTAFYLKASFSINIRKFIAIKILIPILHTGALILLAVSLVLFRDRESIRRLIFFGKRVIRRSRAFFCSVRLNEIFQGK